MTDQTKVNKLNIDGRRAEIHVQEQEANGVIQRVTTHFEEIVPLEIKKRISEKVAPLVMERITEEFNGTTTTRTVERIADEPMKLTDLKPVQPCVSKEDVTEIVKSVIDQTKRNSYSLPSLPKLFGNKQLAPVVPTPPGPSGIVTADSQSPMYYILIVVQALILAVLVWQLFIR
jgi:uncharacterized membrane-anchored protein YjiN (DUF445 family)